MSKTSYDGLALAGSRQTDRAVRRREVDDMAEDVTAAVERFSSGGGSRDYTKYTVGGFGAVFALMLIVAFYLREDAKRTRQMSYASLVFLGAGALLCAYKGLYAASDKKNVFTLFSVIFAVVFLAQTYYVREAYDDVDGTVSAEQEQANQLTYVGALAGAIGAGYHLYKRR